jgi:hypothetical protein
MIYAHVAGIPLEETLAMGGPALLTALGAAGTQHHARLGRRRSTRDAKNGPSARCAPTGARLRSRTHANPQSQEEPCSS